MTRDQPHAPIDAGPWIGFGLVMAVSVFGAVVIALPNAALPAIEHDLALTSAGGALSWTLTFAAVAAFIVPAGQLSDRIGRERVLLFGVVGVAALCVLSALTQSGSMFLALRFLQGAAISAIFAASTGIVNVIFPDRARRGIAFAIFGLAFGLGLGLGPVMGAAFENWRVGFLTTALALVVLGAGVWLTTPLRPGVAGRRIDIIGAALLAVALSLLIVAMDQGRAWGWITTASTPVVVGWQWPFDVSIVAVMLALSGVSFVVLTWYEGVLRRRGEDPLIEMRYFAYPSYRLGVIVASLLFFGLLPLFVVFPQVSQILLGQGPLAMALTVAPVGIGAAIGGLLSAPIGKWLGSKWTVVLGMSTAAVASLLTIPVIRSALGVAGFSTSIFVVGVTVGVAYARVTELTLVDIEASGSAHAAGLMFSIRSTAGAMGSVVLAGIITIVVVHTMPLLAQAQDGATLAEAMDLAQNVAAAVPAATRAGDGRALAEVVSTNPIVSLQVPAYVDAFRVVVGLSAVAFGIAAGVALAVPGRPRDG